MPIFPCRLVPDFPVQDDKLIALTFVVSPVSPGSLVEPGLEYAPIFTILYLSLNLLYAPLLMPRHPKSVMVLANQSTRGTGTWLIVLAAIVILVALGLLWIMAKNNITASSAPTSWLSLC